MGIDFTGIVQLQDAVEIQQKSIDRDSPQGGSFTAILVVRRPGLAEVEAILHFRLDEYDSLPGAPDIRTDAVRTRLVEKLIANWRSRSFSLVNENNAVQLLSNSN